MKRFYILEDLFLFVWFLFLFFFFEEMRSQYFVFDMNLSLVFREVSQTGKTVCRVACV